MTSGSEQLWDCSAALHTCAVEVKYIAMKWDGMSCKYNRPGQRQSLCPPRSMWPSDPRCRVSGRRLRSCGSCCCGRCRRARCIRVNSTPAPLGCGARWKTCSHSSATRSGFSPHSLCRLCHQNFFCAAGCYVHGSCSAGRAGLLWGSGSEPGSGHHP